MTRLIKVASNLKKELGKYPTIKRIIRVLTSKGWNVLFFSDETDELIRKLHIEDMARTNKAFTVCVEKTYLIFVYDKLPYREINTLLLHEAGHILLHHNFKNISNDDNHDADVFARLVLSPCTWGHYILAVLIIIIALPAFLNIIYSGIENKPLEYLPSTYSTSLSESKQPLSSQNVVITTGGEKYHTPNCYIVKDKTNIIAITLDEAIQMGKEPCKICNP